MFANFATAIGSSAAVTMALLYVMNLLIVIQPQAFVEPRERGQLAWLPDRHPERPPETIKPIIEKETFMPPEPPTTMVATDAHSGPGISVPKAAPPPVRGFDRTGLHIRDRTLVVMVRVSPTYPARAQQEGLEGWVLVQFDVLANGTVGNINVVESSNRIFESAARKAASRFRFKPRVVDGVAQVTTGVQNIFRFQMEN